jgi:phage/plasmid-like protein (TIGR03299 family)
MSHEVTEKDTGWMFRTPAWHRLFDVGNKRPKGIPQMRKSSGLTWDVETVPFITLPQLHKLLKHRPTANAKQLVAAAGDWSSPNHRAIVRNDTDDVLGTWSEKGEPWTNQQGFAFADALLGELLSEALFSIREGRNVCLLFEFPEHITVGGDVVRRFLYVRLDHTGRGAALIMCTNVRVQCGNTDRMAIQEAKARDGIIRIRHIGNLTEQVHEARNVLDLAVDYGKLNFKKFGDRLAKQKLAERKLAAIVDELWPQTSDTKRAIKSADDRRDLILSVYRGDTSHEKVDFDTTGNAPGSKWCAYNALVEYDQHYSRVVVGKDTSDPERAAAERRFVRATEDPNRIQSRALDLIVAA